MSTNSQAFPSWRTTQFRLLGILPLLFFLSRAAQYAVLARTPEQILWSCHISNLVLALGMFFAQPLLIRIAVFWLILGVPPWILDWVMADWSETKLARLVSVISHLGGCVMSIVALRRIGARRGSWLPSLVYFLLLQQITRWLTEPGIYTNVNVAHFAYGPWKDLFTSYWKYWVVNTSFVLLILAILDFVLVRVAPLRTE